MREDTNSEGIKFHHERISNELHLLSKANLMVQGNVEVIDTSFREEILRITGKYIGEEISPGVSIRQNWRHCENILRAVKGRKDAEDLEVLEISISASGITILCRVLKERF